MSGSLARRAREAIEFLPAADALRETPPHPLGRWLPWSIALLFCVGVTWSVVGRVDIVAVAPGKLVPSGRVKVIQPLEHGVIARIPVDEGDTVIPGQVLVELDVTVAGAERERIAGELDAARQERAQAEAVLQALGRAAAEMRNEASERSGERPSLLDARIRAAVEEYRASLRASRQEEERRRAEHAATRSRLAQVEATLPLVTEQAAGMKSLVDRSMAARAQWLGLERERIGLVAERDIQRSRLRMIAASLDAIREQRRSFAASYEGKYLGIAAESRRRARSLAKELVKASEQVARHQLRSPIAGVVQALTVHTVGGVVTPGQALLQVVPADVPLLAEAWIENKDIGFVREGDEVVVKIHAFPFTKYGTVDGRIVTLSKDAAANEERGLAYAARISLSRASLDIEGNEVGLSAGMGVTAEVRIGTRRLVEFVLSPVIRALREGARER